MGININSNLSLGSKLPLDSRQVVDTLDDLLALDTNILYNGIQVYVNELDVRYQYHEDYNETSTGNWKLSTGGGGEDAVIPYIGDNGNWYVNENDTGVPATGQDGMSAYEVAVAFNGFEGTEEEWLESLKGADGDDGTTYTPSIGEVTTVDSNELASATVSVNTETKEAVFNFAIPKGNKGLDGVQISDNETVEDKTWSSKKTSSKIAEKIDKTNILTALDDAATDDQVYSAKLVNDELDKKANNDEVLKKTDIVDNLTSTDTDKPLSANQGKILNDTKLNKTDANKLNCVTIDNVSLKEYILTNFTEIRKTYYLIAKTTCTDLPKASNFYITVETPGLYTYKVTAKELNDSNGKYVCTYRTISSSWSDWEKVLSSSDITDTIDINSSGTKIPNVKAIYDDVIEGKIIDQTVIDTYGTEILKYPLGIWRIDRGTIADKFSDLPVKTMCGRIEITSINSNINENPWNSNWGYRAFNFESHNGTNYFRKLNSEYGAGIKHDTGWQKVCGTSVADVPNTVIVSEDTNVKLNSSCYYTVINGVCYVSLWGFQCTEVGQYVVNSSMPKTRLTMKGLCTYGRNGYEGGCAFVFYDNNGNNKLYVEAKITEPLYGSFSYPVAE